MVRSEVYVNILPGAGVQQGDNVLEGGPVIGTLTPAVLHQRISAKIKFYSK